MNTPPGVPEMRLWASLVACRFCGETGHYEPGWVDGAGTSRQYHTTCASCGKPLTMEIGPNTLDRFSPDEMLTAITAFVARASSDVRESEAKELVVFALGCIGELLKVVLPDERDARLSRSWLEAEQARLTRLASGPWPPPASDLAPTPAIANAELAGQNYGRAELSRARIVDTDLTGADFSFATLDGAMIERCTFVEANLCSAWMLHARITGGRWAAATLDRARLGLAEVRDVDLSRASLKGSFWGHAHVTNARFDAAIFADAVLDHATFDRSSFREASFETSWVNEGGTSQGAVFVECDLTGANWTGRLLANTRFVRCKLAGARGKPASIDGLVLEGCNLDQPTFLALLGWPETTGSYRIVGSCGSADLRSGWRITIHLKCDHPPTEAEARRALEPEMLATFEARGGDPNLMDCSVHVVSITPE